MTITMPELPQLKKSDLARDIPQRAAMLARLRAGDVCDLVVDTETSDLSKYFSLPTALGAVVADPFTREIIHVHERTVQFPKDIATMDVIAGLVTERSPETFGHGMRADLAVAELFDLIRGTPKMIADHYKDLSKRIAAHNDAAGDTIPLPPEGDDAVIHYQYLSNRRTKADRAARIKDPKTTREFKDPIYIPMRDADGNVVYDAAIDALGKFVYWRDDDGLWRRTAAKKTVLLHNHRADNNWLWLWFLMYNLPGQFLTHTKEHQAFMLDTIPLAREVALLGPQGRNGLKLGTRIDPDLGTVSSSSLDSIMAANKRIANTRIGVNDGVRMPDGSQADPRMGHVSPAYDALKTYALYCYCMDIAPDLVAFKKRMADHDIIGHELMSPLPDGTPKPFSFLRTRYPYIDAHAGVTLNIDKAYGDFKKAVVLAVDLLKEDPEDPFALLLPDGRNVFDLTHEDWASLIQKGYTDRASPIEVLSLSKSPMVQTIERGFETGRLQGVTPETLNRRAQMLFRDLSLRDRVLEAYASVRDRQDATDKVADPQPEEHVLSTIGEPPHLPIQRKDSLEADEMRRMLYERAKSKIDFYAKRNEYLKTLMRPYPEIEGADPLPLAYESYKDVFFKTMGKYERLMRGSWLTDKERKEVPIIRVPSYRDVEFDSNSAVQKFLWDLRFRALKKGWLVDVDRNHYRVVDEKTGREIPLSRLATMDMKHFRDMMDPIKGSWDVYFEHLNYQQNFLANIFVLAGLKKELFELDGDWKLWFKSKQALRHHGSPGIDAAYQRMPTHERNLLEIRRIKSGAINAKDDLKRYATDPDLAYSVRQKLIEGLPGREQILEAYEIWSQKGVDKNRWSEKTLAYAGYDSGGRRQENITYMISVDAFDRATKLTLPDAAPVHPLRNDLAGEMVYPVPVDAKLRKLWDAGKLAGLVDTVFQTPHTKQDYVLPKAKFTLTTLEHGSYDYQRVKRIFNDSALPDIDPSQTPIMMVSAEGCFPLAGVRAIEPHFALPVQGQHRFTALVAPEIAGYMSTGGTYSRRLNGIAVPDYGYDTTHGYKLDKGDTVRLREMAADGKETGWEVPVTLSGITYMSLAEFEALYAARKVSTAFARTYGFAGPEQMYTEIAQWFTGYDKPKSDPLNRIMLLRFQSVKPGTGMDYFHPSLTPRAAILENYDKSLSLMQNRLI